MNKNELLTKLSKAEKLLSEVIDFVDTLEDDEQYRPWILAEAIDAENYTIKAKEVVDKHFEKLRR